MRRSRRRRHHLLHIVRRSPVAYWALALTVAATTAGAGYRTLAGAEAARRQWGATRHVAVALRLLPAGEPIPADGVADRVLPASVVPDDAVAGLPLGRVPLAPIFPGEAIVAGRLAPDGLRGIAALLPPGTRGVAVPAGPASVAVVVGDEVDILATLDARPTLVVAEGAVVVAVDDDAVTLAVTAADAPRVAFALAQGQVALAVRGGPGGPPAVTGATGTTWPAVPAARSPP